MDSILNILLIVSGIILMTIYYKSAFKNVLKNPLKFAKYTMIWILIIFFLSLFIDEVYIKSNDNKKIINSEDYLEI